MKGVTWESVIHKKSAASFTGLDCKYETMYITEYYNHNTVSKRWHHLIHSRILVTWVIPVATVCWKGVEEKTRKAKVLDISPSTRFHRPRLSHPESPALLIHKTTWLCPDPPYLGHDTDFSAWTLNHPTIHWSINFIGWSLGDSPGILGRPFTSDSARLSGSGSSGKVGSSISPSDSS